jgi:uncharacterized protein (TIGR03000 family)
MSCSLPRVLVGLGGLAALVFLTAPLKAQAPGPEPARVDVRLPATATLEIEGKKTTSTGELRHFVSPPLTPGKKYTYTLKATWKAADGKEQTRTQTVQVYPGKTTEVDFFKKDGKNGKTDDKDRTAGGGEGATGRAPRPPDVPYVPSPPAVVDKMLDMAKIKKDDVVYDPGCGDGRIVIAAAKKYGCKAYGFDIDPDRVKEARENVKKEKVEDLVTIEEKDAFTLDLSKATVVMLYMTREFNARFLPQLEKLKAGARVVSHDYPVGTVKEDDKVTLDVGGRTHTVYLYKAPLKEER